MALKFRIDQTEYYALSPITREVYLETDPGSYRLNIDNPETDALKNALARTREERNAARAHLSAVSQIDPDPIVARQKYDEVIARADALPDPASVMDQAGCDAELARMKTAHEATIAELETKHREVMDAGRKEILELKRDALLAAAMQAGGVDAPVILMPHLAAHIRLDGDPLADDLAVHVIDPKSGHVRYGADGAPITVPQLLEQWRATNPDSSRCFADPLAFKMASGRNGKH